MQDDLAWLCSWYASHCDGTWEHDRRFRIETVDNPGWWVTINVDDTPWERVPFERIEEGEDDDNYDDQGNQIGPWMTCDTKGTEFWASCSPDRLPKVLRVFREWIEGHPA